MTNNDVLRRIRYIFDYDDKQMVAIYAAADGKVKWRQMSYWLKKDDDVDYQSCNDSELATFLNGLINDKRGKKDGEQPKPEAKLTNNLIFVKLKIALNLKAEDILALMELAGFTMSKHELSALFRKPGHKNHRECNDQILRNFLQGLQIKYRGETAPKPVFQWKKIPE
jgi:uncharacterized protein YehS (DUF1456 family)